MQLISHGIVILNKSVLFSNKSNCSAGRGTDSLHELGDRYLSSQCLILARFYILLIVWNFFVVFISLRERMAFQHVSLHLKCLPNSLTLFDIDIISLAFHIREISVWGMACTFDQYVLSNFSSETFETQNPAWASWNIVFIKKVISLSKHLHLMG